MLEAEKLTKRYPGNNSDTLSEIDLSLPDCGLVFFIGKSGSGKTTLLQILGGMDEKFEGSLSFDRKDLKAFTPGEKEDYLFSKVSFVFQSFRSEESETVKENLGKVLSITTLSKDEKEEKIRSVLTQLGLRGKEKQVFKDLSGGEKKRVSLARALIKDSSILLADEPLASLNKDWRERITSILIKESEKKLVIVITHEVDEIPRKATIYELENGKLKKIQDGKKREAKVSPPSYTRASFKGIELIKALWATWKERKEFFLITLFALSIALFSISFSCQLSGGVSSSLKEAMTSYMDENAMVITPREETWFHDGLESADAAQIKYLERAYPDHILSASTFYKSSLNDCFKSDQSFQIQYGNKRVAEDRISLDHFLEFRMPQECSELTIYGQKEDLSEDDIILALPEEMIMSLFMLLFSEPVKYLTEENLEEIGSALNRANVFLFMEIQKEEWRYHLTHAFPIRGIALSSKEFIVHTSENFNVHFAEDVLHFESVIEEESLDVPWSLKYSSGFRVYQNQVSSFLRNFLQDERNNAYVLEVIRHPLYYESEEISTHNHIALYRDYLPKIHLSEIQNYYRNYPSLLSDLTYSSPVYTYTAGGYISGFMKPFFFSRRKEKLNTIEDESRYSNEDLGQFQGTFIEVDGDVIKADLSSAIDREGLKFKPLTSETEDPEYGRKPENDEEIAISSKMALKLFATISEALNSDLHTLTLDSVKKVDQGFQNDFTQSSLKITGIYQEEEYKIYQDALFPLCYAFSHTKLTPEETRITEVVLKADLESKTLQDYRFDIQEFGDYEIDFPMLLIVQNIEKTMRQISDLFLLFAFLSLLSSCFLMTLTLFLILQKDQKNIGILLSLGYRKKEIVTYYFIFSQTLAFISFLSAIFLSIGTEKILKDTLENMISAYSFSVLPFLISFIIGFSIASVSVLLLKKKLKNLSPLDAFLKKNR